MSVSATDSEADSLLADSGAAKRKPGTKKGARPPTALCIGIPFSLAPMLLERWRSNIGNLADRSRP